MYVRLQFLEFKHLLPALLHRRYKATRGKQVLLLHHLKFAYFLIFSGAKQVSQMSQMFYLRSCNNRIPTTVVDIISSLDLPFFTATT